MNLVVLVVDSLRADRLSGNGYHRLTSPFIDQLMQRSVCFDNFFTPITPTLPAITTLFTGQCPLRHGVLTRKGNASITSDAPWLPRIMSRHGYATAAVDNLADRMPYCARGFDHYINLRARDQEYHSAFEMNVPALEWIGKQRGKPFLLYLRYGDTHTPYAPPSRYASLFYEGDPTSRNRGSLDEFYMGPPGWPGPLEQSMVSDWLQPAARSHPSHSGIRIGDIEWCRAQYDAEVRVSDDGLAQLCEGLEKLGRLQDTAIILLGDHGESLYLGA